MRILYLITGLGLGGAEKVVVDLADQMSLLGCDVKIAYLKALVQHKSSNVELICLGFDSLTNFIEASKKFRQLVSIFQPNVVHAHMVHANILQDSIELK